MVKPGDAIAGRYRVITRIAEGGMGVLWRARHTELDIDVALKLVSTRARSRGTLKRFKREAQAVARLRSPHIVQILDYGVFEDEPYLVMELLRGEDLAALLAREGKLPLGHAERVLTGVCKALEFAHAAGIVHRDLKPANIFLEKVGTEEVVKVLDFGVAKDLGEPVDPASTTQMGGLGSPAYMSPEQVWGHETERASDIWALGVVTFEMLTGKNPFLDQTQAKIFERIVRDELPRVGAYDATLPSGFETFFARTLARTPSERVASPSEFLNEFRKAAGSANPSPAAIETGTAIGASAEAVADTSRAAITERRRQGGGKLKPFGAAGILILALGLGLLLLLAMVFGRRGTETDSGASAARGAPPAVQRAPEPAELVQRPLPDAAEPEARAPAATTSVAVETRASATARGEPAQKPPAVRARAATAMPAASATPASQALDPRFGIPLER